MGAGPPPSRWPAIHGGNVITIPERGLAEHVKETALALSLTLTPQELQSLDAAHLPDRAVPLDQALVSGPILRGDPAHRAIVMFGVGWTMPPRSSRLSAYWRRLPSQLSRTF